MKQSCKRKREISEDEIHQYIVNKAVKFAKRLKPEGDYFVWRKKIESDIKSRRELAVDELFSAEAQNKRQVEREIELQKIRERRQIRTAARSKRLDADDDRDEEIGRSLTADDHRDGEEIGRSLTADDHRDGEIGTVTKVAQVLEDEEGDAVAEVEVEDSDSVEKPKYVNRVRTGYEWNKYNRTHYDGDNPPPKVVYGYKFNLFYPDLLHRSTIPSYSLERDGGGDTCIVRFHAGPPYQDVAFRIVNREWDYSPKNGFKCTFDGGILRLYFNVKRLRYRR